MGARAGSDGLLLAAIVITLPVGIAGSVGVYFVYGLVRTVAQVFGSDPARTDGTTAPWLGVTDGILVVVLFATVAAANVVVAHDLVGVVARSVRLRRRRRAAEVAPRPPGQTPWSRTNHP